MGLIKTWTFNSNVMVIDGSNTQKWGQSIAIQLKQFLINYAGWEVVSSSNGSSFSASDLWGTTLTNVVWNQSGSNRSHITLKSPEGLVAGANGSWLGDQSRYWLTIDMVSSNSSTYYYWDLIIHRVSPSGGTTNVRPTSLKENKHAASYMQCFPNTTGIAGKLHFGGVSSGENIGGVIKGAGAFYFIVCTTTGFAHYMGITPSTDVQLFGLNDYPYSSAFFYGYLNSDVFLIDKSGATNGNGLGLLLGWGHDGETSTFSTMVLKDINGGTYNAIGAGSNAAGDINGENPNSELWLHNSNSGKTFNICKIADFFYTGATLNNFYSDSNITTYHNSIKTNYGNVLWLPTTQTLSY